MNDKKINCHKCGADGLKTDSKSRIWCERCLNLDMHTPVKRDSPKIYRNQKCVCGSGLKYKKCCEIKDTYGN